MKKIDLVNIFIALNSPDLRECKRTKFAYFMAKNLKLLDTVIDPLRKTEETINKILQPYEANRIELCKLHSVKDSDGNPVINNGEYVINDDTKPIMQKALQDLSVEFKDAKEAYQKQNEDFSAILQEEVEIELHKIKLDHLPDELTAKVITTLMPLIDE